MATVQPADQVDLEANHKCQQHYLRNDVLESFAWHDITVKVKNRKTKQIVDILSGAGGSVLAGEMLAIMGPSGCGKTTLLNSLAQRQPAHGAELTGSIMVNDGVEWDMSLLRKLAVYVEQDDALIGSLSVAETMMFASSLASANSIPHNERTRRIQSLVEDFGLREHIHTIVGTPFKKGLSGGQKKRLSVASRLVTAPKIVFLDEPTSGLDSTMSYEVIRRIRAIAKENNLIVIASIHQPSTTTFKLFDKLCLLSQGKTIYFGKLAEASAYFSERGFPMPEETNPAEFYLDLINTDIGKIDESVFDRTARLGNDWIASTRFDELRQEYERKHNTHDNILHATKEPDVSSHEAATFITVLQVLLHRSWLKAYRDPVAYTIRIAMYFGLAILMGTVFLLFGDNQKFIQPYINAIFFGGAFMSFMAVAYVPAFIEDHATYVKERANGLAGPFPFMLSNFVIGLPFLFTFALTFSIITYFLIGFHASATSFFVYVVWLFLDLLAAESLVVLVSSLIPNFVAALAITAFANGLWMCVDGFLVPLPILNVFWRYVFYYINYQAYVFQGMMVNEMEHRSYACDTVGAGYFCQYTSRPGDPGRIDGTTVLKAVGIARNREGQWFGIMVAIIVVYRILGYLALRFRNLG